MSMLKQRTLKAPVKTTGVGLHTGARVDLTLRPAAPNTGIVFHRTDLPQSIAIPADAMHVGRHAPVVHHRARRRAHLHRRAHPVGARRARHRQPPRRRRRSRDSDHGRQRRAVRVSPAVGRDRRAGRTEALSQDPGAGRGARWRQVGALRAVRRFQARFHDRFPASGVRQREPPRGDRLRRAFLREGSGARAHVRLHAGRGGDARRGSRARRQPAERHRARRVPHPEHAKDCATTTSS